MFESGSTAVLEPEVEHPAGPYADVREVIARADRAHREACRAELELLRAIGEVDATGAWEGDEVYGVDHWVQMRYGVSVWKAQRWVHAARALQDLPRCSEALGTGELGLDKVVELTRFATSQSEGGLIGWARKVSSGAIRHRGDLEARRERGEAERVELARSVRSWYEDDGRWFGLEARLPAAHGAVVATALEREAGRLPVLRPMRTIPTPARHAWPMRW